MRVSLVEPGAVATELSSPQPSGDPRADRAALRPASSGCEAADIADAIAYIVTRPRRVAVNEVLIRPTEQEG